MRSHNKFLWRNKEIISVTDSDLKHCNEGLQNFYLENRSSDTETTALLEQSGCSGSVQPR